MDCGDGDLNAVMRSPIHLTPLTQFYADIGVTQRDLIAAQRGC